MLSLYNSLTRRVEPFEPLHPPKVGVYTCGPTVYGHVHIGNWSTFVAADVLVRWLRERYEVTYVQNITDVEDKIIRDSRAAGMDRKSFTDKWTAIYLKGLEQLDARRMIDHLPLATEHIDGMVAMIQTLLDKGHAYVAEDGSIYYRVASFPTYGELAHLDPESLQAGASGRVAADEYEKDEVADFALWKAYVPADGDVRWSPTFMIDGTPRVLEGRPGWHIECSVMSMDILGEEFDIHMGGEDLLFPHHQNEIAQSEAATGHSPFVRVWLHRRHLRVDGGKMSKSLKNFYTIEDVIDRCGPDGPASFRYLVATSHYRHSLDFSWSAMDRAHATRRGLVEARARFAKLAEGAQASAAFQAFEDRFTAAMDDDLATSEAIAAVHDAVGEANRQAHGEALAAADAAAVVALMDRADRVLGLALEEEGPALSPEVQALLEQRAAARAARSWAESDRLRDVLRDQHGLVVKDTSDGQELTKA
ncbi:MAG: cysteine--tRNA ligase [Planctomycetota bacterium]